jgi:hypothetical protein
LDISRESEILEMTGATAEQQLKFLRDLQTIIDGGQFVASYKFALLIALADISIECSPAADGTLRITLDQLSERFIEVYWRQAAPFLGKEPLWQNTGTQAAIISTIAGVRGNASTFAQARKSRKWAALVRRARKIILDQPLWRLQRVGPLTLTCFYDQPLEDDCIVLKPGIPSCFRVLYGTVQAIVQLAWLRYVQNLPRNQKLVGAGHDIADFLFGSDRSVLTPLRNGLLELQHGDCFYCQSALREKSEVDHFIPWAHYSRDLGHNFVLAHRACNHSKRDLLADVPHLERWLSRNSTASSALSALFDRARMQHEVETSKRVAEWCYGNVEEARGLVWLRKDELVPLSANWRSAYAKS